jgi:alkyl sulfatase BDS1-like metallo-beta-lactamase superfamily hydrolase
MGEILDLAEALWTGEATTYQYHPFSPPHGLEKVADDTWFYRGFSNSIFRDTPEGMVVVDTGLFLDSNLRFEAIRAEIDTPLDTAIFTHGHTDHVFGMNHYIDEAREKNWAIPKAVAHEAMPARFRRYRETLGWNDAINGRQFIGRSNLGGWPEEYHFPEITYADRLELVVGRVRVLLRHSKGETDDHTWVFFPDTGVLCTGDLFIWAVPNGGNPQKVQRFCKQWARGLREMAALNPNVLCPGHGVPVVGQPRVKQALEDTALLLESLFEQTIALMNQGLSLNTILHQVQAPRDLLQKPYLHPVYDEPEFIVRNIWRLYGGWYDGTPSHLKPAADQDLATEIARLAGGADKLAARAEALTKKGDHRLACHLVDWSLRIAPDDAGVKAAAYNVYMARAQAEPSTMAMGIFLSAARESGVEMEAASNLVFDLQDKRGQEIEKIPTTKF